MQITTLQDFLKYFNINKSITFDEFKELYMMLLEDCCLAH